MYSLANNSRCAENKIVHIVGQDAINDPYTIQVREFRFGLAGSLVVSIELQGEDFVSRTYHPPFEAKRFHYRLHPWNELVARLINFLAPLDIWSFRTVEHE
jgi:hypothetical protein